MLARRSQPTFAAACVFSGLGLVMRPNALRIIFGLLLGVLAAFFIGALAQANLAEIDKLPDRVTFSQCPHCRTVHGWTPKDTFVSEDMQIGRPNP